MKDGFGSYHPFLPFCYFAGMMACSMLLLHPALLACSCAGAFCYLWRLRGGKAALRALGWLLPVAAVVGLVNPLFNHRGATILGYLGDNPLTLESVVYGGVSGLMFAAAILWFACMSAVMTADKTLYLFGRLSPALALTLSMAMRFAPRFARQFREVADAQACLGRGMKDGRLPARLRNGARVLGMMITWALENGVDTADSMRARGYGLHPRTSFGLYRWSGRDSGLLCALVLLFGGCIVCAALGLGRAQYFPTVALAPLSAGSIGFYGLYLALCFAPVLTDGKEALRWRRTQSNI